MHATPEARTLRAGSGAAVLPRAAPRPPAAAGPAPGTGSPTGRRRGCPDARCSVRIMAGSPAYRHPGPSSACAPTWLVRIEECPDDWPHGVVLRFILPPVHDTRVDSLRDVCLRRNVCWQESLYRWGTRACTPFLRRVMAWVRRVAATHAGPGLFGERSLVGSMRQRSESGR